MPVRPEKYNGIDLNRAVRCCRTCHDALHRHIEDSDMAETYFHEGIIWSHPGLSLFFKMRREELLSQPIVPDRECESEVCVLRDGLEVDRSSSNPERIYQTVEG